MDCHLIPQHAYIWGRDYRRTASYILRNEHLQVGLELIPLLFSVTTSVSMGSGPVCRACVRHNIWPTPVGSDNQKKKSKIIIFIKLFRTHFHPYLYLQDEYDAMREELNITGFKLGKAYTQHQPSSLTVNDISKAVRPVVSVVPVVSVAPVLVVGLAEGILLLPPPPSLLLVPLPVPLLLLLLSLTLAPPLTPLPEPQDHRGDLPAGL